jgi:hypothetical protein
MRRAGWWHCVPPYAELFVSLIGFSRRALTQMLNGGELRALGGLARCPDGCAEAVLIADGSTIRQLSGLVIDG